MVLFITLVGCVKEAELASPLDASHATRVALTYSYEAKDHPQLNCLLELEPTGSEGVAFQFRINPEVAHHKIVYAQPGKYRIASIKCLGIGTIFPDHDHLFSILPNKISYQGHFYLTTKSYGNSVVFNSSLSSPLTGEEVSAQLKELAPQARSLFVSGITGKPITESIANKAGRIHRVHISSQGAEQAKVPDELFSKILQCTREEVENNSAALGTLKVLAKFQAAKLTSIETIDNNNTFSDQIEPCIKQSLNEVSVSKGVSEFIIEL
jgi:hypothetical protein